MPEQEQAEDRVSRDDSELSFKEFFKQKYQNNSSVPASQMKGFSVFFVCVFYNIVN